jgi:MinD-like ATPase involved in chromosome partitioning or flagellar assembly
MMQILTIIGKGDAGKTTTAVNLATVAAGLNMSAGVLDFDPQASGYRVEHVAPERRHQCATVPAGTAGGR